MTGYIFLILLFITGYIIKKRAGSWMTPSMLAITFAFLYLLIPVLLVPSGEINLFASLYVFACILLFTSSSFLFPRTIPQRTVSDHQLSYTFGNSVLKKLFWLFTPLLIILIILDIQTQGFSVAQILFNIREVAGGYSSLLYEGGFVSNIYKTIYLTLLYPITAIGGFLYATKHKQRRRYLIASLAPSLFIALSQSVKGMFIVCIFVLIGSIFLINSYRGVELKINTKTLTLLPIAGIGIFSFAIASFYMRGFLQDSNSIETILYYFRNYAAGHVLAFSDWFSNRYFNRSMLVYEQEELQWGFYTFMSIFRLLGDNRPIPFGIYTEYLNYNNLFETNLYTIFRGLITDFGAIPSAALIGIAGLVFNYSYHRIRLGKTHLIHAVTYISLVVMIYQSYTISTLIWPTFLIGMALLPGILFLSRMALPRTHRSYQ